MSKHYATSTKFAGQRASVGRIVCVKYGGDILAGIVVTISLDGERPIVRMLSDQSPDARHDSAFGFDATFALPFEDVKTEDEIRTLVDRCWFWPPRV
jgi:hypothetical protein